MENEKAQSTEFGSDLHFKQPNKLTDEKIEFVISEFIEYEKNVELNKVRRNYKKKRLELEAELKNRNKID